MIIHSRPFGSFGYCTAGPVPGVRRPWTPPLPHRTRPVPDLKLQPDLQVAPNPNRNRNANRGAGHSREPELVQRRSLEQVPGQTRVRDREQRVVLTRTFPKEETLLGQHRSDSIRDSARGSDPLGPRPRITVPVTAAPRREISGRTCGLRCGEAPSRPLPLLRD
jgi:hypothetical protein